jgi:hypothetical protein
MPDLMASLSTLPTDEYPASTPAVVFTSDLPPEFLLHTVLAAKRHKSVEVPHAVARYLPTVLQFHGDYHGCATAALMSIDNDLNLYTPGDHSALRTTRIVATAVYVGAPPRFVRAVVEALFWSSSLLRIFPAMHTALARPQLSPLLHEIRQQEVPAVALDFLSPVFRPGLGTSARPIDLPAVSRLAWSGTGIKTNHYQCRVLGVSEATRRSALQLVHQGSKPNDRLRRTLLQEIKEVFQAGGEVANLLLGHEKSTDSDFCVRCAWV